MAEKSPQEMKPDTLTIFVKDQSGVETHFRIKTHTLLKKVFTAYKKKTGQESVDSVRFLFDGERLKDDDTPDKLGLEEGDQIDVVMMMDGGNSITKFML